MAAWNNTLAKQQKKSFQVFSLACAFSLLAWTTRLLIGLTLLLAVLLPHWAIATEVPHIQVSSFLTG